MQVADDAEVDQLEDRGLGVLVDRHDRLGGLHAGAVLDRTGDAGRDVELRARRSCRSGRPGAGGGTSRRRWPPGRRRRRRRGRRPAPRSPRSSPPSRPRGRRRRRSRPRTAPGRSPFSSTDPVGDPRALGGVGRASTLTSTRSAAPAAASAATELGRTVMIGVPVVTVERTTVEPPNTGCSAVTGPPSAVDVGGVGDHAGAGLDRQPAGDLLALGAGGEQHRGRRGCRRPAARAPRPSGATRYADELGVRRRRRPWRRRTAARDSFAASKPLPTNTAAGSPSRRASVSSSAVTFLTSPSAWSTRTRTSAMSVVQPFSDELLGREELGELVRRRRPRP